MSILSMTSIGKSVKLAVNVDDDAGVMVDGIVAALAVGSDRDASDRIGSTALILREGLT